MRVLSLAPLLAGLAIGATGAQEPLASPPGKGACVPYDHYDPLALDQCARERLSEGDATTARILVARAARLAPYDRRVARNLEDLAAGATPGIAPPAAPRPAVPQSRARDILPEPPRLWPAK
jgi:hypothetical protein